MQPRFRALTAIPPAVALLCVLFTGCGSSGTRRDDQRPEPKPEYATSGVTTVEGAELQNRPAGRIEEFLMGRVPGLRVYRDERGEYQLRIRGGSSFGGSDEPLLVIDGMPIQEGGVSRVLSGLDPRDVDKVQVLKDASSTAMYGSRGANGVIIIKTKRGGQ